MTDLWQAQRQALGAFIRQQRQRAGLSLRQLAELTSLSNPTDAIRADPRLADDQKAALIAVYRSMLY